jgi:hypothetical protein
MGANIRRGSNQIEEDLQGFYRDEEGVLREMPNLSVIPTRDDVTGRLIPPDYIGIQDGLIKDVRPEKGSWEKWWRTRLGVIYIMYDPALGYQKRPAGTKE